MRLCWLRASGCLLWLFLSAHIIPKRRSTDANKPVRVTGVVKKVEWTNPHIWFYVEGKDEVSGLAAVWGFSGGAPNGLRRRGVTKDSLKVGDTVKVQGIRAKDGSPNAASRGVTFSDGRQVFTASEQTPAPK